MRNAIPRSKIVIIEPILDGELRLPREHISAHIVHDGGFSAEFAHVADALAQLAQESDEVDVVALGEDFGGEGALFLRAEEREVREEGVDVAEDGVREDCGGFGGG